MKSEKEHMVSVELNKGLRKTFERMCSEYGWKSSDEFFVDFQNFISHIDITAIDVLTNDLDLPMLRGELIIKTNAPEGE